MRLSDYIKNVLEKEGIPTPAPVQEAVIEEPKVELTESVPYVPTKPDEVEGMMAAGIDPLHLVRTYKQAPSSVVLRALEQASPPLKSHALVHPGIPVDELVKAATDPVYHGAVSINPKTPANVLEQLSKSEFEHVLDNVAGNKNTPKHVLHEMARKFKGHAIGETAQKALGRKK